MPSLRSSDSTIEVPSKRASIQFAETLVTGVSRPVTNDEQWTLYNFERHACKCKKCRKPWRVFEEGRQLCSTGRELAIEVAHLLFKLRSDGNVYYKSKSEHQEIRIEIPQDYNNVAGLFQALKYGGKGFLKSPKSYDRTYEVLPRIPSRPSRSSRPQPQFAHEWHGYQRETIRPSSSHKKHKKSRQAPERMSRGSLYQDDLRAQEEQWYRESLHQLNGLNLEVQPQYTPIYSSYR